MVVEHLLDFVGRDVLAPAPDAVLDPVDEVQATPFVEPTGVAGVEPQIAPCFDRLVVHGEVADVEAERRAGSYEDLPHRPDLERLIGVGVGDDHLVVVV